MVDAFEGVSSKASAVMRNELQLFIVCKAKLQLHHESKSNSMIKGPVLGAGVRLHALWSTTLRMPSHEP